MRKKIKKISLPSFINKFFYSFKLKRVKIENLFVGLNNSKTRKTEYINIKNTPHYFFALKYIESRNIPPLNDFIIYQDYIDSNPEDPRSKVKFLSLIDSIMKNGYNFEESPILVFYSFKRPFPFQRWDVADGFHRLAILAALGNENIKVLILKRRQSVFMRLKKRLLNALK